jgi:hypothetical protein
MLIPVDFPAPSQKEKTMKRIACVMGLLLVLGCGSKAPEAEEPTAKDAPVEVAEVEEAPAEWAAMDFAQKKMFMNDTVKPQMGELFLPQHPDFNCPTCHGANFEQVQFKMPNDLEPLNPEKMPFSSEDEKIKAAAQFMAEKVVPRMAGLLGYQPYDPQTKEGFGCFGCHAMAK